MKFGHGRRNVKRKSAKSALNFKTLQQQQRQPIDPPGAITTVPAAIAVTTTKECSTSPTNCPTTTSSKRSTQVLVDKEGPSAVPGTSLALFTTLDPTEAPSFSSKSFHDGDSFVLPCDYYNNQEADSFSIDDDPYLQSSRHNNNRKTNSQQQQSPQDENMSSSGNKNLESINNRVITFKSLTIGRLDQRDPSNSTLCLSTKDSSSNNKSREDDGNRSTQDEEEEGRTQWTPDTHSESSNPAEEDGDLAEVAPPQKTTKLTSLGTFDFPVANTTTTRAAKVISVKGSSKSLGGGCFDIPAAEETSTALSSSNEDDDDARGPQTPPTDKPASGGIGFTTPLSAISKGLKALGSTLALPRALQFDLLVARQPQEAAPTTPVSQAEPTEDPVQSARMTKLLLRAEKDCDYWNGVVTTLMSSYGKVHSKTAEGLLQLGYAYMMSREYAQAVIAFQSACRIRKQLQRSEDDQLAFARIVDAIGMAWARVTQDEDQDHCQKAMTALEEAFQIRYDLLGPSHIDTVETLNKIASVHVHLREYSEACNAYWEVFFARKAIFGSDHPSVAIAAHALGNVLVKLASTEDAANYFQIAVDIYEKMDLPNKHPAVKRLMSDYKRLDRICLTSRVPAQQRLPSHR